MFVQLGIHVSVSGTVIASLSAQKCLNFEADPAPPGGLQWGEISVLKARIRSDRAIENRMGGPRTNGEEQRVRESSVVDFASRSPIDDYVHTYVYTYISTRAAHEQLHSVCNWVARKYAPW